MGPHRTGARISRGLLVAVVLLQTGAYFTAEYVEYRDVMNRFGCRWRPSEKGPGSRIAGKAQIHARLALRNDGHPGLILRP